MRSKVDRPPNNDIDSKTFQEKPHLATADTPAVHVGLSSRQPTKMNEERPLAFLAQFNLSDIASAGGTDLGLPGWGLLSFFYDAESEPWGFDPGDSAGFQLMWFGDPVLEPQKPPQTLGAPFKSALLSPEFRECVPPLATFAVSERATDTNSVRAQLEGIFSNKATREEYLNSRHALGGWALSDPRGNGGRVSTRK